MQDLETRFAALERTNRRYRLGMTICLSLMAIIGLAGFGQVGQQNQQTWPRNIVADSITAQSINAYTGTISQLGTNRATVQYIIVQDGSAESLQIKNLRATTLAAQRAAFGPILASQLDVRGSSGVNSISLLPSGDGGTVLLLDSNGNPKVTLRGGDNGSQLQMGSKAGWNALDFTTDDKSGILKILGLSGKTMASLGHNDKGDGIVVAHTRNGNRGAWLSSEDDGTAGKVNVQRQDGTPLATLDSDTKGGRLVILDGKDEIARFPPK